MLIRIEGKSTADEVRYSFLPRHHFAVVAQQAEHFLGKEEVDSSNLFNSSIRKPPISCEMGGFFSYPAE